MADRHGLWEYDGWPLLDRRSLGHAFDANMTGHVVFLGFAGTRDFPIPASLAPLRLNVLLHAEAPYVPRRSHR